MDYLIVLYLECSEKMTVYAGMNDDTGQNKGGLVARRSHPSAGIFPAALRHHVRYGVCRGIVRCSTCCGIRSGYKYSSPKSYSYRSENEAQFWEHQEVKERYRHLFRMESGPGYLSDLTRIEAEELRTLIRQRRLISSPGAGSRFS